MSSPSPSPCICATGISCPTGLFVPSILCGAAYGRLVSSLGAACQSSVNPRPPCQQADICVAGRQSHQHIDEGTCALSITPVLLADSQPGLSPLDPHPSSAYLPQVDVFVATSLLRLGSRTNTSMEAPMRFSSPSTFPRQCCILTFSPLHLALLTLSRHRLASLLRTCSRTNTLMRAPTHYWAPPPS